jgi:5-methylcytosine-specific restriction endonuclease McrA|tara:strand:+ start:37 stop:285 length:249 start_codon:yes stop_codon:yes gene_type:complete
MTKKTKEINKILNLTEQQAKQILEMLESLRNINAQTDDKCPIDYDMVCKLDGMEHQLANIVGATVECKHGHYSRWEGSYAYI